ncbi:MAG TPA: hypothetical protein VKA68_02725, partial [bacterium]|nr:hypothetical protein [bacterium]
LDGGNWIRWNGLRPYDRWVWIEVFDESELRVPVDFNLQKGDHHLEVAYREDDTWLDRLLITDDPHYYPRGYGQFNGESKPVRTELQPEQGRITAPMEIRRSDISGSLASVGVSANRERELGYADIDFAIPATDDYVILGRVQAPSDEENSFYISLNGGEEVIWHLPEQDDRDSWFWYPVSGRDEDLVTPALYKLQKGTHSLRIRNREAGTRIDQIVVCNWSDFLTRFATVKGSTILAGF